MSAVLNQPVVIDNGTGIIKAGFAGADKPKVLNDSCKALTAVDTLLCTAGNKALRYLLVHIGRVISIAILVDLKATIGRCSWLWMTAFPCGRKNCC